MENILETNIVNIYTEFMLKFSTDNHKSINELKQEGLKYSQTLEEELGYTHTIFHNKLIDVANFKVEVENNPSIASLIFSLGKKNKNDTCL